LVVLSIIFIFIQTENSHSAVLAEEIVDEIKADKMKPGCRIGFQRNFLADVNDPLSTPPYSIDVKWMCGGARPVQVDRYDVQGGSPTIAGVVYGKRRTVAILVKWSVNSRAADVQGDYYKIYAYELLNSKTLPLVQNKKLMKQLGDGWIGNDHGREVRFPLSNAPAIKMALDRLGY